MSWAREYFNRFRDESQSCIQCGRIPLVEDRIEVGREVRESKVGLFCVNVALWCSRS